jgi:hypothetical protein
MVKHIEIKASCDGIYCRDQASVNPKSGQPYSIEFVIPVEEMKDSPYRTDPDSWLGHIEQRMNEIGWTMTKDGKTYCGDCIKEALSFREEYEAERETPIPKRKEG